MPPDTPEQGDPIPLKSFNPKPIIFPKIIGFTGKPPAQGVSGKGFTGLVLPCCSFVKTARL
jgi:hypothetical protein